MSSLSPYPPVMILGCGRSGTSIFGELFQDLGTHTYFSEPPFGEMLEWFANGMAAKVPTESEEFPPDTGLSIKLRAVLSRSPQTKFFWIVRHPFDAICSLRIGIDNNWGHHPRPPDWCSWLERPLIERCAHHWAYINAYGYDAVRDRALLVRFEDMIDSPFDFACKVLSSMEVPLEDGMDGLKYWADRVQNTNNERFVEAKTSRNYSRRDHEVRVGRWRENLSKREVSAVVPIVAEANSRFGYDLEDDRT